VLQCVLQCRMYMMYESCVYIANCVAVRVAVCVAVCVAVKNVNDVGITCVYTRIYARLHFIVTSVTSSDIGKFVIIISLLSW